MKGEHRRHYFFRDAVRQLAGLETLADVRHMLDHTKDVPAVVISPLPFFFRGKLELASGRLDDIQVGAGQKTFRLALATDASRAQSVILVVNVRASPGPPWHRLSPRVCCPSARYYTTTKQRILDKVFTKESPW